MQSAVETAGSNLADREVLPPTARRREQEQSKTEEHRREGLRQDLHPEEQHRHRRERLPKRHPLVSRPEEHRHPVPVPARQQERERDQPPEHLQDRMMAL